MFNPNFNSYYKKLANYSLHWLPGDTKTLYEKNLKENYQLLKSNNWIDSSFTYKFNSHGFRCDEFTDNPTVMFLGCSFTIGIGIPEETTWTNVVSKKLNMNCANLGQAAGSSDTAFRLCLGWIDIIKPQVVCLLPPHGIRLELVNNNSIHHYHARGDHISEYYDNFLKDWSVDDNNDYFNTLKNTIAIESICTSRNIKYVSLEMEKFSKLDLARDLAHWGTVSNNNFAEYALTKF